MNKGIHVNRSFAPAKSSITRHISVARSKFNCNTFSIFVSAPKQKRIIMDDASCAELATYIKKENITVIAHSTYSSSPWKGERANIDFVRAEVAACSAAGIHGLVVHLPKASMETVMKYVNELVVDHSNVRIYLETPATVRPDCFFDTPDKLNALFAQLNPAHFGLCIDTAHLHTNGIRLTTSDEMRTYLSAVNKDIPLMFHLNDSERVLGSGPDSHAALCKGHIWNHDRSGLVELIKYAQLNGNPIILERDDNDLYTGDIALINEIYEGIAKTIAVPITLDPHVASTGVSPDTSSISCIPKFP